MVWTATFVGAALIAGAAAFHHLGIFAKLRAVAVGAGLVLAGTAGWAGRLLGNVAGWLVHLADTAMAWAVGIGAAGALGTLVLAIYLLHDLHPANPAGKRTFWFAVALSALIVAGVTGVGPLNRLPAGVRHSVVDVRSAFNGARG